MCESEIQKKKDAVLKFVVLFPLNNSSFRAGI